LSTRLLNKLQWDFGEFLGVEIPLDFGDAADHEQDPEFFKGYT